ncbi:DNA cytosine methyltransferase [Elizabethkingia anophelis]|uniref:DNA cytosine methyltransferase n=1 Tax=Elizabethkingia anophelis TaxID=1117645 RepID=UPI0016293D4E|nr:DNA cytosine methyltransferase [Elizabethkingia anophelis]MCT3642289.1 DNA cytosine methyltransferase [Elizabethkingia anophelis]
MNNRFIKISALAISLLYVDLFCGAGGTSTGVELAQVHGEKCAKVIACVNHDKNAIASHSANHPDSLHFTEDIRTLELSPLVDYAAKMRKEYPFAKLILWASLECTNHSKAKGGMSRDADSRTLANHLFRYINALSPDSIQIENVEEFLIWGPLEIKEIHKNGTSYCPLEVVTIDKKKKLKELRPVWIPIKERKAEFYNEWIDKVQEYGYSYDYRLLNAADYSAYTSRKRLFIQFSIKNMPTVWPAPTHAKVPEVNLFEIKEQWKPVREVLKLNKIGEDIFAKNRAINTFKRIYKGIVSQVGETHFLTSYYGNGSAHSIDSPIGTLTTKDRYALHYIQYDYGNSYTTSIDTVAGSITTSPKHNLMKIQFEVGKYVGPKINKKDPEIVKQIKKYMLEHQISKIYMRMLDIDELLQIQGFPKDYKLIGTKTEKKKFIGNSVEVTMAKVLCEAIAYRLHNNRIAA